VGDGQVVSFVDVPGHVRFLANMLAGVGGVVACVFVVDATEGWRAQSEEHLRILELVGVAHGMVALTKAEVAGPDGVELARMELAERVAGTFLADAEVVAVDAPAGTGLDELRAALARLVATTPAAADRGRPRLWIDRAFAARGSGTVVTGTLLDGGLAVDDRLVLVPGEVEVRLRALQAHHEAVASLPPGSRAALNLSGVAHHEVERGQVLVRAGQWHRARTVDASLRVLPALGHRVSRTGAYVAHVGSGEFPVRLRLLGRPSLAPGEEGWVRLHLPVALPLLPGDRYVLRESGRAETVGGGEVLDVDPHLPASRARPDRSVDRVVAERGWVEPDELERLTGERRAPTVGRWVAAPEAVAAAEEALRARVEVAGALGVDLAGLDERERALLEGAEGLAVDRGRVRPVGTADPLVDHPYVLALEAAPFSPPEPEGVDPDELRQLRQRGLVLEEGGVRFAASAVDRAAAIVAGLLRDRPEGVTMSELREALGTSRRYALPLAALLDARGVTRRRGDVRIAGPRLPSA
jgi:selenocysteine-specific elongation factor